MELFDQHLKRLTTAVTLQKPDRVPIILSADSFCAKQQGVTLADYLSDNVRASEINLKTIAQLGDIDGVEFAIPGAKTLGASFFMNLKLPGRDLPPDALWQVDEIAPMTVEDYDVILEKGWEEFAKELLTNKLPRSLADFMEFLQTDFAKVMMNHIQAGIVPAVEYPAVIPFETLSAARGMTNFTRDLYRIPDKVEAVMNIMHEAEIARIKYAMHMGPKVPFSIFIGGARSASENISPKFWNRFVAPYLHQLVEAVVAEGSFAFLHFDSNWERDLEWFKGLPKGKCVFASDNATNMFKLKEVLGDHMCLYGDVPPAMLTLGTPDDVYNYSRRLITELGPTGLILGPACIVPFNAKFENVKAMVSAATGK